MSDFYEMDFMKSTIILVKVDEIHIILQSANDCGIGIEWSKFFGVWVELNDQSFLESALEWPYVYYVPPFLRDKLHLVRVIAIEKEFDIAI